MDGWITIGTKLDTKESDKQLKQYQRKLEQTAKENERLLNKKMRVELDINKASTEMDNLEAKILNVDARLAGLKDKAAGFISSSAQATPTYEKLTQKISALELQKNNLISKSDLLNQKYQGLVVSQNNINEKLEQNVLAQKKLNSEAKKMDGAFKLSGLSSIKGSIDNMNKSLTNSIQRISKMAMSIFGLASAYYAMRTVTSIISQYDQQIAADIEYMRYALAMALKPVIETILNIVKAIMFYVGYIVKALFGVDIWARSSADSFEKSQQSIKQSNKEAKKLEKTMKSLAGFDQINMLQDSSRDSGSGSSGAGGGSGIKTPSFDLGEPKDYPIPSWLQWLIDHKDEVIAVLAGIAAGLWAIGHGFSFLQALGIGLMIGGIVYAIEGLLKYLKDPTWENFGQMIQGIGIAIVGLGLLIGNVPAIVAGAIVLIVGTIMKYWDEIKAFLNQGIGWLRGKGREIFEMVFGDVLTPLYDGIVNSLETLLKVVDKIFGIIRGVFDELISFIKNVFTGNWSGALKNLANILGYICDLMANIITGALSIIIDVAVGVVKSVGNIIVQVFKGVINGVLAFLETFLNAPIEAVNGLIGIVNKIPGIKLGKLKKLKLPRLATGGIVDVPRTGVNIGGAIAGEAGAEGVLPLTNQDTMQRLGQEIGKWITINLDLTNTIDGRVLNKRLETLRNDKNFARNGV